MSSYETLRTPGGRKKGQAVNTPNPGPVNAPPLFLAVALFELLHTPGRIHIFCRACIKGMAGGTGVDLHVLHGRTGMNHVPANACNRGVLIFWMDFFFHSLILFDPRFKQGQPLPKTAYLTTALP